jgi:opacity protein-like surface antigen
MLAVLTLASSARAQGSSERRYSYFVSGDFNGAVAPSEFTDYYSTGFGVMGGIEFPVTPQWSFIGAIGYKRFAPAEGTIRGWWSDPGEYPGSSNVSVSEGTLQAGTISILSKGALRTGDSMTYPYVKGGLGLTIGGADQVKVNFKNGSGSQQTAWVAGADSGTNFSVQIGLGLEHMLAERKAIFADVGLAVVFIDGLANPTVAPLNVGIRF